MEDRFFNNDPVFMKSLIGKSASVTTVENKLHKGIIYLIDPLSKTLVLTNRSDGKHQVDLIMHHGIKSFNVTDSEIDPNYALKEEPEDVQESPELKERRKKLASWFKLNLIDVEQNGELLVLPDKSTISPPYGPEQCMCTNTIVLERLRKIINEMPCDEC